MGSKGLGPWRVQGGALAFFTSIMNLIESDLLEITSDQLRAARALPRLEQAELAERARVSVVTIRRIEAMRGRVASRTVDGVRRALEQAGAEFLPDGVRRRRPDEEAVFQDLRGISLRSAERLRGRAVLTDADLYDEDGLPA